MSKGLRTTLWILSSLAMLWTLLAVVGFLAMGAMGGGGMMGGMTGSMADTTMQGRGMMSGGGMARWGTVGMMVQMVLTGILVLGLDGVFVYLVATSRRPQSAG